MQRNEWDLPDPPGVAPVRGPRVWLWIAWVLGALALVLGAFLVPIPVFYTFLPGPVRDVQDLVEIDGSKTYPSEGELLLTTVSVDTQVTLSEALVAFVADDKSVVLREQVTGGGTLEELEEQQRQEMRASKQQARVVALTALGLAEPDGDGAEVVETVPNFPAHGRLREGDLIVSIEGDPVATTCDVSDHITRTDIGDELRLTVRRNGELHQVELETVQNPADPGVPFLGVAMQDVNFEFEPGVEVGFRTGDIAGPSAGVMFALALYDRLTPEDLTGGKTIAGTGTIGCNGRVGAIGGIEQKVASAEARGADVFLAPAGNFVAAEGAAGDIEVVSIATFDEALRYLE